MSSQTAPIEVFYSYAHKDEALRNELEKHLSMLHRQGLISSWYDRQIVAGTDWAQAIDTHLERASLILLLVSSDFLASDYCYGVEMQRALERHKQGLARVIPLLLRAVDWQRAPFAHLQMLPRDGKPVTSWTNQDEAFADIVTGIRHVIEQYPTVPVTRFRASSIEQQNREYLIRRVRSFWIKGIFEQSLHHATLMTLGLQEAPAAVANPWQLVVQESEHESTTLPPGTRITEVYDNADGELLILGEPGAGKTTLLLELARDLLNRAEQNKTHPIPVVFNLSSWSVERQHLTFWLVEELTVKYQVPHRVGNAWIDNNDVLLLLDGLDEVAEAERSACIEAINAYRREHHLVPVVVCSRKDEYLTQRKQVMLRSAVAIQPLSTQQIAEYLSSVGEPLEAVQVALQNDQGLREMVETPLMLSIVAQAYQGKTMDDLVAMSSPQIRRHQIFETYVQRMLQRREFQTNYTSRQTKRWLVWLARQLKQHNQTVFSIERTQPDWLIGDRVFWIYESLAVRFLDVLAGSIVTLLIITMVFSTTLSAALELCYCSVGGLVSGLLGKGKRVSSLAEGSNVSMHRSLWKHMITLRSPGNGLILGLIYGLTYASANGLRIGLIYGSIFGVVGALLSNIFGQSVLKRPLEEKVGQPRENHWYELVNFGYLRIALGVGLSYGLGYGLSTEITNQLHISQSSVLANILFYILAYVLIGVLICLILERRKRAIQPAEMIVWSWRTLWGNLITIRHWGNALAVGLLVGSIVGLSIGLREEQFRIGFFFGLNAALIFGVSYWLLLAILRALSSEMIDEPQRVKPNQGVWASGRNSIIIGFISGFVSWLVCSLSYTLTYTLIDNFSAGWIIGQSIAKSVAIFVGLTIGLLWGLLNGGLAFLQHWTLRLLLWYVGSIPWNYPRFLDYAVDHILLRKVGGSYIFIHQELLEYFASLDKDSL